MSIENDVLKLYKEIRNVVQDYIVNGEGDHEYKQDVAYNTVISVITRAIMDGSEPDGWQEELEAINEHIKNYLNKKIEEAGAEDE